MNSYFCFFTSQSCIYPVFTDELKRSKKEVERPKFSFEETSDEEELEGMFVFCCYIIIPSSYLYSLQIAMNLIQMLRHIKAAFWDIFKCVLYNSSTTVRILKFLLY